MGTSKAALEWHGSTLLHRVAAVLVRTIDGPVVVVRAPGQVLPSLPRGVEVVDDPVEALGPLQGIVTGLAAVAGRAPVAFVCPTDLPLLHPAFVRCVLRGLGPDVDVALPVARGYPQPLAAAYRTTLAPRVAALVAAARMRPATLFAEVRTLRLDDATLLTDPELAAADPDLDSLLNVNEPGEYRGARARPAPEITVRRPGGRPCLVHAATVGGAAALFDVARPLLATIDGAGETRDPLSPLVAGDTVTFLRADG